MCGISNFHRRALNAAAAKGFEGHYWQRRDTAIFSEPNTSREEPALIIDLAGEASAQDVEAVVEQHNAQVEDLMGA